jgi:hypothetical protein
MRLPEGKRLALSAGWKWFILPADTQVEVLELNPSQVIPTPPPQVITNPVAGWKTAKSMLIAMEQFRIRAQCEFFHIHRHSILSVS